MFTKEKYYAVRTGDMYLAQEGKGMMEENYTFNRSNMLLFENESLAENYALNTGHDLWKVDNIETYVVAIDEKMLIDYIKDECKNGIIKAVENKGIKGD